jgi:hypothetical protein
MVYGSGCQEKLPIEREIKSIWIVAAVIVLTLSEATAVSAQLQANAGMGPREVVERFVQMDLDGKLLTNADNEEASELLYSPYPYSQDRAMIVVDHYELRGPSRQGNSTTFSIDFHEWGRLNSSLAFSQEEGDIAGKPVRVREYVHVARTTLHNELGPNGHMTTVKGSPSWRIEAIPSGSHISIETAIRYVKEMREKTIDPATKENAGKTIATLEGLESTRQSPVSVRTSPVHVVKEFCSLDSEGKRLSPKEAGELSNLAVHPDSPHWEKIVVVENWAVSNASISEQHKATAVVEYLSLGRIDLNTGLLQPEPTSPVKELVNFNLILANAPVAAGEHSPIETNADSWKIDGPLPEPHLTIDAAIQYLTELRDKSSSPVIKKNTNQSLAQLKTLRQTAQ